MQKIRSGDTVVLIAGKDKGRQGKVIKVLKCKPKVGRRTSGLKVIVENLNLVKKHVAKDPNNQDKPSGIISKEAAMHISNVAIFNPSTSKADRVGFKVLENGNKVRVFKSNGEVIDG